MEINEELSQIEFKNREYLINHIPYDREIAFFQSIKNGDLEEMRKLFKPLAVDGYGRLSQNPLRNIKYHLIITVSFITRYCIEGGLEMETAYNMSDLFIRKIDVCNSEEGVIRLHKEVCEEYVKKMAASKTKKLYSKPIILCIDYIYDNLHEQIKLEDLAEISELSPSYLSKLFHKEVGITIAQYITNKKVAAAKNLLVYTDHSTIDISNYLCFSSESHFISVFRKNCGLTPKKFRDAYFRTKLSDGK